MSNGGSYDPHSIEPKIYKFWEDGGYFHAEPDPDRKSYVIDIPLPNVTGSLHLGHALNNTIQDVHIRYKRMSGFNAMWMPGMDHAGIATQAVVEKRLKEQENLTRHDVGRDGLVERIWKWKEESGGRILEQLRRIGCSCDWQRTRFTLDEICAKAVYEAFFRLFKDGLIYRGLRLVNWDAHLQTAVADDEIIHETVQGNIWHYHYPIEGHDATLPDAKAGVDYLTVATTRPETMLGDTAVAVHPEDERYKHLIGKNCILPLMDRPIPIVADGILVKREFGTGCVKVTPGHDPNDYACGLRNNLEQINILTTDGKINENGGKYQGQNVMDARKQVVADLDALGLLEKVEPHEHEVGHSDRSKTPIEPMLSEQWFVKMEGLCDLAMGAVRDGRVKFHPDRYANTYLDWLGEKRDWCISRQLWWGHRIPVWGYYGLRHVFETPQAAIGHGQIREDFRQELQSWIQSGRASFCYEDKPPSKPDDLEDRESFAVNTQFVCLRDPADADAVSRLQEAGFIQDPDVLDTWFSSALWPYSTLSWPDENPDLDYFYPTSTLVTAREIITLWVARMVMTSLYFNDKIPFTDVHIHPNIQDGVGRRMSKSAGNGVDPLDLIDLYGTDAMRYTLAQMATETQDIRMPVSYMCPHCEALTPQESVVPKNQTPSQVHKVKCKACKQQFATVWAPADLKKELGVARDTSDKFEQGRNYCNKIWQVATGFVFPNVAANVAANPANVAADPRVGRSQPADAGPENVAAGASPAEDTKPRPLKSEDLAIEDHWILSRLSACIEECDRRFEAFQINEIANTLYSFFWGDFCDWYVELVKPRLFSRNDAGENVTHADESSNVARQVLAWVLDQSLRLMHPIMPYMTEELWRRFNEVAPQRGLKKVDEQGGALIVAKWPDASAWRREADVEGDMRTLQSIIRALRDIRTNVNKLRSASKEKAVRTLPAAAIKIDAKTAKMLRERAAMVQRLGQCDAFDAGPDVTRPPKSMSTVLDGGVEVYVPVGDLADLTIETKRLKKERDELAGHLKRLEGKLNNEGFLKKAPPDVVAGENARLLELKEKLTAVMRNIEAVGE